MADNITSLNLSSTKSWRVSLVEQELLTLPEHLSSLPVFSGVRVTRSLVLYVCFVDRCLSFCTFSFCHCVVCSSSICGFWLPLWYLQTLLIQYHNTKTTLMPLNISNKQVDIKFSMQEALVDRLHQVRSNPLDLS
jgi:hypothetical protein